MRISVLTLLLGVAACTSDAPHASVVVSDSAGIRIAANDHRRPHWHRSEVWVVRGPPRLQLGNVPGNPDHALYRVAHSRRLRDGRIAVANTGVGDVRIYGPGGELLQTFAIDDGSGAVPVRVEELPGDSLLVVTSDGSLVLFDRTGERVARSRLGAAGELTSAPEIVGAFRDGTLLVRVNHPADPEATGVGWKRVRLLRYDSSGRPLGSLGDFQAELVLFAQRGAYIFGPVAQYAAADSTIWYTAGNRYEVREVAPSGRTLRIIRIDRQRGKVLQADVFAYRQAVQRRVSGTSDEATMEATLEASVFADSFPGYDQMLVDEVGDVWLRNYRWFDIGGAAHSWTVFDPAGRYLGEVRIPGGLEVHQIGADFVLGRMANRQGMEAVYLWRLEKPGAAPASG